MIFLDALVLKVREGGTVQRKACYLALGVTVEGERDVLGTWFQETEGAKFWMQILSKLKQRRTNRHRLDRGGDRRANRTLHVIAVCRLRHCPRTRAYAARRSAEGLSTRDIIRCLKRYIARELYHSLRADLANLAPPRPPGRASTITCGAGPIAISKRRT